jgi:hypothetical protein
MRALLVCVVMAAALPYASFAQTHKPLTNDDIVNMTKQGFDSALIIKAIETSETHFDVSPEALADLKNAGVSQSVMEAMLSAQTAKPSVSNEAASGASAAAVDSRKPLCDVDGCLLREGTEVPLKFVNAISSKTASEGDPVEFVLGEDLKVGEEVVVQRDAHAKATVTNAKKAGMMGKPGELNVELLYLMAGGNHIRLRGRKGREGDSKTGTAVALTVLFGPIGLIKHGKNVEIAAGTPLTAYVDQDIWLPPIQ